MSELRVTHTIRENKVDDHAEKYGHHTLGEEQPDDMPRQSANANQVQAKAESFTIAILTAPWHLKCCRKQMLEYR